MSKVSRCTALMELFIIMHFIMWLALLTEKIKSKYCSVIGYPSGQEKAVSMLGQNPDVNILLSPLHILSR